MTGHVAAALLDLLFLGGCNVIPIQHYDREANSREKVNKMMRIIN